MKHPGADDDGLWFFERGPEWNRVQVETWNGMCPFLIESYAVPSSRRCATVRETIDRVVSLLRIRAPA